MRQDQVCHDGACVPRPPQLLWAAEQLWEVPPSPATASIVHPVDRDWEHASAEVRRDPHTCGRLADQGITTILGVGDSRARGILDHLWFHLNASNSEGMAYVDLDKTPLKVCATDCPTHPTLLSTVAYSFATYDDAKSQQEEHTCIGVTPHPTPCARMPAIMNVFVSVHLRSVDPFF